MKHRSVVLPPIRRQSSLGRIAAGPELGSDRTSGRCSGPCSPWPSPEPPVSGRPVSIWGFGAGSPRPASGRVVQDSIIRQTITPDLLLPQRATSMTFIRSNLLFSSYSIQSSRIACSGPGVGKRLNFVRVRSGRGSITTTTPKFMVGPRTNFGSAPPRCSLPSCPVKPTRNSRAESRGGAGLPME